MLVLQNLFAMPATFASWQWVVEVFSDEQRMIQIGAVIAVVAIYLLSRTNK